MSKSLPTLEEQLKLHEGKQIHSTYYDFANGQMTTKEFLSEVDKLLKQALLIAEQRGMHRALDTWQTPEYGEKTNFFTT